MRAGRPKRREERRNFQVNFGSFLYMFFLLPLSMPYINWASQEGCLFYLEVKEVLTPVLGPSFVLVLWAFPFFVC